MNTWLHKTTCLSLAAFYLMLSALGHSMHSHGSCCADQHAAVAPGDRDSGLGESASTDCLCGHDHHCPAPSQSAPTDDDGSTGWRSALASDCTHDCGACAVMSQLKVGFASLDFAELVRFETSDFLVRYDAPAPSPAYEAWSPRGPPTRLSA